MRRTPMTKTKRGAILRAVAAAPHTVWCVFFILAPLAFVCYYTFTDPSGSFTLDNLSEVFSPAYLAILERSVLFALEATVICLLIAYPLAYFITRMKERHQPLALMMIMLPMWINLLIRTYSLKLLLESNGVINTVLGTVGIGPIEFLGTDFAVILGMVYNYLPYMVLPIYTCISKIPTNMWEAASDLGASPIVTLIKVILPLSMSGIISGVTMVLVPSISTFYISQKLGGGTFEVIGDTIERQFVTGALNVGAAISLVMMVLILISITIMNKFSDEDGGIIV
jgi:spermidine/putrescine transport system permease protein